MTVTFTLKMAADKLIEAFTDTTIAGIYFVFLSFKEYSATVSAYIFM